PEDARPLLLAALRYPWPAAADNAAAALATRDDRGAVPELVQLLDAPDPSGPTRGADGSPVVRELMRVNHFHNCQLCHAPSWDSSDWVRAPVPSPNRPLPSSFVVRSNPQQGPGWRPGQRSATSPGRSSQAGDHIRADVTY